MKRKSLAQGLGSAVVSVLVVGSLSAQDTTHYGTGSGTQGPQNAFFGVRSGAVTTGPNNAFFGFDAGKVNTSGADNSCFGSQAGFKNTTGFRNSFFGHDAGYSNTTSNRNSFFGAYTGAANSTGSGNSFFGAEAGTLNTTGNGNSFFGEKAGVATTTGQSNSFVGTAAGRRNTSGSHNTAVGYVADVGENLSYATAIGAGAEVTQSNALVLGRSADTVFVPGKLVVTGSVAKGSGSFLIDHPLDPENKLLAHSFVESSEMMNLYNGIVFLDAHGSAEVLLPEWFDALNGDFRYLLTPIGAAAPGLYIAEEVENNRFAIAGGRAGMKVSWQLTGIRKDPYAERHRIEVEQLKPASERGTYLHPEVYQPAASQDVTND